MSLNQTYAMDQRNASRHGKVFGSIDFEVKENISKDVFTTNRSKTVTGTLHLGGREFDLTLSEIRRIAETCKAAESVISKKYKMFL